MLTTTQPDERATLDMEGYLGESGLVMVDEMGVFRWVYVSMKETRWSGTDYFL